MILNAQCYSIDKLRPYHFLANFTKEIVDKCLINRHVIDMEWVESS